MGGERRAPRVGVGQPVERRDRSAGDTRQRRHAGDTRLPVDPDRAATTLALRATAVLGRADPEAFAQRVEQRRAIVFELDGPAVELEAKGQEKLWPQPQVRLAFGLVMANPDWSRPSL